MNQRTATFLVCDDVREEATGKRTLVGVYKEAILVQKFPCALPKICLFISYSTPAEHFQDPISVTVKLDGDAIAESTFPPDADPKPTPSNDSQLQEVRFVFTISPLKISAPCEISVSVTDDQGTELCTSPPLSVGLYDPQRSASE